MKKKINITKNFKLYKKIHGKIKIKVKLTKIDMIKKYRLQTIFHKKIINNNYIIL